MCTGKKACPAGCGGGGSYSMERGRVQEPAGKEARKTGLSDGGWPGMAVQTV